MNFLANPIELLHQLEILSSIFKENFKIFHSGGSSLHSHQHYKSNPDPLVLLRSWCFNFDSGHLLPIWVQLNLPR